MTDPVITKEAQNDLNQAWDYLARVNIKAADRLIDRFTAAARVHARFPESGRAREELAPGLRSFVVRPYVAIYRPEAETIVVLRFLHGRRDIKQILKSS